MLCNKSRVTTRLHIARNYIMRSSTMWHARARSAETLKESQEACLLICYDQWWVSCVVGAIADCIRSLHWKKNHCCLFCPSGACQEARKAVAIGKWCQNFWMKHFQRKPHDKHLENTIKNPMTPCFRRINEVCSRFCGNRQTHTHGQNDYHNPTEHELRVNN